MSKSKEKTKNSIAAQIPHGFLGHSLIILMKYKRESHGFLMDDIPTGGSTKKAAHIPSL
jgi:hypothetical protein